MSGCGGTGHGRRGAIYSTRLATPTRTRPKGSDPGGATCLLPKPTRSTGPRTTALLNSKPPTAVTVRAYGLAHRQPFLGTHSKEGPMHAKGHAGTVSLQ